jgi:hypothetical protein
MVARENLWSICKSPSPLPLYLSRSWLCTIFAHCHQISSQIECFESRYISHAIKDIDSSLWYWLNLANYDWLKCPKHYADVFLICFLPMALTILTCVCVCVCVCLCRYEFTKHFLLVHFFSMWCAYLLYASIRIESIHISSSE